MSKKEFVIDLKVDFPSLFSQLGWKDEIPESLWQALTPIYEDDWSFNTGRNPNQGKQDLDFSFMASCVNIPRVGESLSGNINMENLLEQFFSKNEKYLNEYVGIVNKDLFTYSFIVQEVFYIPVRLYVQDKEDEPDFYIPHVKCRFGWELE